MTAATLEDATPGRPFTAHLEVWKAHDRVFLIVTENNASLEIITVKADPQLADALRRAFESIPVGRYFDEWHWISVGPGVGISRQLVEDLVLTSHDLVTRPHR